MRVVNVRACVRAVVKRVLQCLGKRISHLGRTDRGVFGRFPALEVARNLVGFENSFFFSIVVVAFGARQKYDGRKKNSYISVSPPLYVRWCA